MKTMRRKNFFTIGTFLAAVAVLMMAATASLGDSDSTSTAQFLRIGVGTRAIAMGGAYTAVGEDITSLYWNPAGIAMQEGRETEVLYNAFFQDVFQAYVAYSQPVLRRGSSFGVSLNYVGIGDDIDERDETGKKIGTLDFSNYALGLSYGHKFNGWIRAGATLKYVRQELDKYGGDAVALDLGTQLHPYPKWDNLALALTIQNLGSNMKVETEDEPLPLTLRFGAAYRFKLLGNWFTLAADLEKPRDTDVKFRSGAEYWFGDILALRLGMHTGDEAEGPSLGLAYRAKSIGPVKWLDLEIGYAYQPFDILGDAHRISLHFRF